MTQTPRDSDVTPAQRAAAAIETVELLTDIRLSSAPAILVGSAVGLVIFIAVSVGLGLVLAALMAMLQPTGTLASILAIAWLAGSLVATAVLVRRALRWIDTRLRRRGWPTLS